MRVLPGGLNDGHTSHDMHGFPVIRTLHLAFLSNDLNGPVHGHSGSEVSRLARRALGRPGPKRLSS